MKMIIVCWDTTYFVKVTEIDMTWISGRFKVINTIDPMDLHGSFPWKYITNITMVK